MNKNKAITISSDLKLLIIGIVAVIGININITGQTVKVRLSPEYKLSKNIELQGHLYSDDSGHYMYFNKRKGRKVTVILEKYDTEFKQVFSKDYLSSKKGMYSLQIKYFQNKFAWLLYEKNKKENYIEYFITPISLTGEVSEPISIGKFSYKRKKDMPKVHWQVSEDSTKILFVAESDIDNKKDNYESFVSVIDSDFNKIYTKKIKLPFSEKRTKLLSLEITNKGDVLFLTKVYDARNRRENKGWGSNSKPAYQIKLYKVNQNVENAVDFQLNLGDDFIRGMGLQSDKSNNLACIGFYSKSPAGALQGVFYMKLNSSNGHVDFAEKHRFTKEELASFGSKNTSKSKDGGLDKEFTFQKIHYKNNGEMMVTAEENYILVTNLRDANGYNNYSEFYNSNSIVTINISKDGIVEDVNIIPKKHQDLSPMYLYHTTLMTDDNVYFIYNDDKDNLRKKITDPNKIKRVSSSKDCVAVISDYGENGKLNRKALFTKKEAKALLRPSFSNQINKSEIFFFTNKPKITIGVMGKKFGKNNLRFGTISLE